MGFNGLTEYVLGILLSFIALNAARNLDTLNTWASKLVLFDQIQDL